MKLIINTQIRLFLIYIFLHSILLNQEKLNFSANSLETITVDSLEQQIFESNVIINKNSMRLFADKAIYQPDLNLVTLINNIKMYDLNDSLFCDSLILYDKEQKSFEAMRNINFYKKGEVYEKCLGKGPEVGAIHAGRAVSCNSFSLYPKSTPKPIRH